MTAPQKPAPRTIRFDLKAPYEGFYVEARADFPARTLADLSSGDFAKAMTAFDKLVVSHNLTDNDNQVVKSVMDADPYELVTKAMEGWVEALENSHRAEVGSAARRQRNSSQPPD